MRFLVAYDGSPLAKSALLRAAEFGSATGSTVSAVTVLPRDGTLARERGWLGPDETFDQASVERQVENDVHELVPDALRTCIVVEKHAARGRITRSIRSTAEDTGVDVLFVGSESAGRFVSALSSVGQGVAYGEYDLHVVRQLHPDVE